jgi:prepilin-type N-terminal cleavage/methylation domain-containing protein
VKARETAVEEEQMSTERPAAEAGFSLVELLIAMLVTGIISGAIYGLLSTGQGAFRREPELSDRQQNIRIAMDLIQRDAENAGMRIPAFMQHFTDGLNGLGPAVPSGGNADFLEIFGNDGQCPVLDACRGNTGSSVTTFAQLPGCYTLPGIVLVTGTAGQGTVMWATSPGVGTTSSCSGTGTNGHAVFPHGLAPRFNPPGGPGFDVQSLGIIQVTRYEVCTDAQGVPNLWRSPSGGVLQGSPTTACPNYDPAVWQLVARGIEDMQVQYLTGAGAWQDTPGLVVQDDYSTLVRQLRVTLTARNTGSRNLQGSSGAAATRFVRGSLTSITAPRAALFYLSQAPAPLWQ